MKDSYLPTVLHLRHLVGFLGERAQFAWWPTEFYAASAWRFLDPVFSRTTRLAKYHGVLEAARKLHDGHLSAGSYHLFRLPEEAEQDIHLLVQCSTGEESAPLIAQGKNAALEALKCLAATDASFKEGPRSVGTISAIDSADTLKAIAGAYYQAFLNNAKTYPYLVG